LSPQRGPVKKRVNESKKRTSGKEPSATRLKRKILVRTMANISAANQSLASREGDQKKLISRSRNPLIFTKRGSNRKDSVLEYADAKKNEGGQEKGARLRGGVWGVNRCLVGNAGETSRRRHRSDLPIRGNARSHLLRPERWTKKKSTRKVQMFPCKCLGTGVYHKTLKRYDRASKTDRTCTAKTP